MDDLKSLYLRIENPMDNKIKWSKLLNIYSASYNYDDFYYRVTKKDKKDTALLFDNEDKKTFCLVMWSIWKSKIVSYTDDELRDLVETKKFDYDIYDLVSKVRNLESVKSYSDLQQILTDSVINKYYSLLFDDYNHKVEVYSDFNIKSTLSYNTVLSIKIDSIKLYKLIKIYINECIKREMPYYIKFNEFGEKVHVNFYTTIENFRKNEEILKVMKKENYLHFHGNYDLLSGNIDEAITIKHKDIYSTREYLKERSLIFFKSFDSVTYEYVVNHLNILVSYKEGRMNIVEYLSTYVMERIIGQIVDNTIKTRQDYFYIANSDDLLNLKKYIKEKIQLNIKDILKERLYLKPDDYDIPLKLNDNKTIKIPVEMFLSGIRNLTSTIISKDGSIEKLYRIRIKNECQFYGVDYDKFCLDSSFVKKLFYNKKTYDRYQKEIDEIHNDIKKVESLENLISSEIDEDTRTRIYDSMNELNKIFNVEEGQ